MAYLVTNNFDRNSEEYTTMKAARSAAMALSRANKYMDGTEIYISEITRTHKSTYCKSCGVAKLEPIS